MLPSRRASRDDFVLLGELLNLKRHVPVVRPAVVRGAIGVPREPAVDAVAPRGLAHVLGAARDGLVHGPHGRRGDHVGEPDRGIARVARPTRIVSLG